MKKIYKGLSPSSKREQLEITCYPVKISPRLLSQSWENRLKISHAFVKVADISNFENKTGSPLLFCHTAPFLF